MLYDKRWEKQLDDIRFDEPWRQILWDAADYIDRHGWCQKRESNPQGNVCAGAAIEKAARGNKDERAKAVLSFALNVGKSMNIVNWNDSPGRTQEDVTAKLRQVAKRR